MEREQSMRVDIPGFNGMAKVVIWARGDPFPVFGKSCGVDTETHLITDSCLHPPLVVLGVWNPYDATTYISYWEDAVYFMRELCVRDVEQRYFNIGFDYWVLSNEDPTWPLAKAVDQGRVRDMQIRVHLHEIAEKGKGFVPGNLWSLAGCSLHFLNLQLDKGEEEGDAAPRKTFRRGTAITDEQMIYLAWDCISTWGIGEAVKPEVTEVTHVKGAISLAKISANGAPVDMQVFDAMEAKLLEARQDARQRLLSFGFPDPDRDATKELGIERDNFIRQYSILLQRQGFSPMLPFEEVMDDEGNVNIVHKMPSKPNLRQMLTYLENYVSNGEHPRNIASAMKSAAETPKLSFTKAIKQAWSETVDKYNLQAFDASKRKIIMIALVGRVLERYNQGDFEHAFEYATDYLDEHPEWLTGEEPIGPKKFFQDHVARVIAQNPGLELDRTPKSKEYKLTKKDQWRLEDMDIHDKFLEAYIDFGHSQKYLSTYLNREYIRSDGKMRGTYTNILRTGRTSCRNPNLQNFPSRDTEYPLRNIFKAPDGGLLCATDYSFIELCAFAQSCLTRFGKSRMADVINAGLDPHRWFAAVKEKLIPPDLKCIGDPKACADLEAWLEEHVTKVQRQNSKAANFGKRKFAAFV